MTLVHLAVAVNICSAVVLIFALLTWRRTLARRALVFLTANTLLILVLADASAPLQVAAMIALAALLLYPQMHSGLHRRRLGKFGKGSQLGTTREGSRCESLTDFDEAMTEPSCRPADVPHARAQWGGMRRDGRGREELG
jgi:hypothetical protein